MITFVVSRGELVLEAFLWFAGAVCTALLYAHVYVQVRQGFLWFAGAVCTVLVYAHVYVQVRHIAHCLLHFVYCMAQCTAVSGLCICAYTILIRIFFFLPFLSFFSSSSFSLLLHWDRGLLRG